MCGREPSAMLRVGLESANRRRVALQFAVLAVSAGVVLAISQMVQAWIVSWMSLGEEVGAHSPLSLEYIRNQGAAFGLFPQFQDLFLVAACVVSVYIVVVAPRRVRSLPLQLALGLILGGALSNALDRLRYGYVVDYFNIHFWPIFNTADVAICVGAIMTVAFVTWSSGGKDAGKEVP